MTKFLVFIFVFTSFFCTPKNAQEAVIHAKGEEELEVSISPNEKIAVTVFHPGKKVKADILVLPGWNFSRRRWLDDTELIVYANKYGYRLICPEMGKTLYEDEYYKQTKLKWASMPGRKFLKDLAIPELQSRNFFNNKKFLLGLSTGARGVALLALDMPNFWDGAAAVSGDYDQSKMRNDRLMALVFGKYNLFRDRWHGNNNIVGRAHEWKTPLYLGHGDRDKVVSVSQSRIFYKKLLQVGKKDFVNYKEVRAGHDFKYWNHTLDEIFLFYESIAKP